MPVGLRRLVECQFGLPILQAVPSRSAWRILTASGVFYLKCTAASGADLPFVIGLHGIVAGRAPGLAPKVMPNRIGEFHFRHDGCNWLLLEGLSGVEAEYGKVEDIRAVAAGLALFHQAAAGDRDSRLPLARYRYGSWTALMEERLDDLNRFKRLSLGENSPFARFYAALWELYHQQAYRALALLKRTDYARFAREAERRREICHHDLAHHNILLDDGSAHFLDLDYAIADNVLHDLVNLIHHVIRLYNWDAKPGREVIANYWLKAPLEGCLAILTFMLLWPEDFWRIGRQRYDERQVWPETRFVDLLRRKCGSPGLRLGCLRDFWLTSCGGRPPF